MQVTDAGDCRAVLCRAGKAVQLSTDQTVDNDAERARLLAAGGQVRWRVDSWRVGAAGIQVSRQVLLLLFPHTVASHTHIVYEVRLARLGFKHMMAKAHFTLSNREDCLTHASISGLLGAKHTWTRT